MAGILARDAGMDHRPDRGQPVYSLKVASGLVGLSPRTMRLYEEQELLAPARTGGNQQRLYSEQDLQWLRCIRDMIHEDSLTVAAIRRLLDLIPCWEVKHCSPEVAEACRPHLRIPNMAGDTTLEAVPEPPPVDEAAEGVVRIDLFYGVQELGGILPCSRCIAVERAARRVALKHPGKVTVHKADIISDEAKQYGVIMSPTLLLDGELLVSGTGISESRLEGYVTERLEADDLSRPPAGDGKEPS